MIDFGNGLKVAKGKQWGNLSIWSNCLSIIPKLVISIAFIDAFTFRPHTGPRSSQMSHIEAVTVNCLEKEESTSYHELVSVSEMYYTRPVWKKTQP